VALCCFVFQTGNVAAQSQASTGQIAGTVLDSAGAAVVNAAVTARNQQTGLEQTATTNEDGLFRFLLLPPGTYNVSAQASGFANATAENVTVTVGAAVDVPLTLGVTGVQEAVTVVADAVETTRQESDAVLNETAINTLPINGRRFQDFVTLTPTAQIDPDRGQISLAGQRGINSNINIDGADYNQPFFGGIRGGERSNNAFTIPQESIREFQVVSTGYTAEFGRSTGGIVNAVTKSGTNDLRGSAFYLLRHKELARKNAFGQVAAPTQQQFGGSIGGPIKENKMFLFGAYEQQIVRNPRQVFFSFLDNIPRNATTGATFNATAFDFFRGLETPFTQTNDAVAFLLRFDYEVNRSNRFNVRYNQSSNEALNAAATGEQIQPTTQRALTSNGTEEDQTYTLVGQLTSFLSPTVVNEL
ncbi:MAG: carboxypeptidase regulatory-like domain-containing protein, partial [Pyrinomonadaceae bacterium]